jgi:hypothetical protein
MTRAELREILDALPETEFPAAEEALRNSAAPRSFRPSTRRPSTTSQTAMTSMATSRRPVAMLPRSAASLPTSSAAACGCRDAARPLSLPLTLRAFRWNGSSCAAYEHKTAHHSAMLDRLAGLILEASHRDARHRAHWQLLRTTSL